MIICPYPFCNARVWLGRLVDPSSGDRCGGKEGAYGGRLAPLQPGMRAGSGLPMRGANVVRRRSVTNPGDPAGAAGAVSGGPADGGGSVPPGRGGSAGGTGPDAVGGRNAASMGPQPVIGPAASGGQTPVVVAQPQAGPPAPVALPADRSGPPIRIRDGPGAAGSRFAPEELARPVAAGRHDRGAVADRDGARCGDHQRGRQQLADERPCSAPRPAQQRGGQVHPGSGR